jgi:hypothetical protein
MAFKNKTMKQTSRIAHDKKDKETDYDQILMATSNTPLTFKEIYKIMFLKRYGGRMFFRPSEVRMIATNFNPTLISRRTSEMVKAETLIECPSRICLESGNKCTTYIKAR